MLNKTEENRKIKATSKNLSYLPHCFYWAMHSQATATLQLTYQIQLRFFFCSTVYSLGVCVLVRPELVETMKRWCDIWIRDAEKTPKWEIGCEEIACLFHAHKTWASNAQDTHTQCFYFCSFTGIHVYALAQDTIPYAYSSSLLNEHSESCDESVFRFIQKKANKSQFMHILKRFSICLCNV